MNIYKGPFNLFIIIFYLLMISCSKDWLNEKPNISLAVPTRISDFQAILDNTSQGGGIYDVSIPFNERESSLNEVFVAEVYVPDNAWPVYVGTHSINCYNWEQDTYNGNETYFEWEWPYRRVLVSNIVIEGITAVTPKNISEQSAWNNVMGAALFFRACAHYNLAQIFAAPYDTQNAKNTLGIPLRLKSDVLTKTERATNEEVYNQITADLRASAGYLPISKPVNEVYQFRPNKAAAHAMLARVFLSMEKYDSALLHAETSLQLHNSLMNFATDCDSSLLFGSVPKFNKEVLGYNSLSSHSPLNPFQIKAPVDTNLYKLYEDNDLRRKVYFDIYDNRMVFKGSYWGFPVPVFSGVATDEMYLIKAECLARNGKVADAMTSLNQLLVTRWRPGTFVDYIAQNEDDALHMILAERRKELCFRGIRWSDLRRLNKDPRFAVTLHRKVKGKDLYLPPNDLRYTFLIPPNIIKMSGIQQNPR